MAKQKWYDDPKIAGDAVYWKPKSEVWFWAAVLAFGAALAVNVFIPFAENVKPRAYRVILTAFIAVLAVLYLIALGRPQFRKKLYH
jgi:NitT/TauT family transport system permease protein